MAMSLVKSAVLRVFYKQVRPASAVTERLTLRLGRPATIQMPSQKAVLTVRRLAKYAMPAAKLYQVQLLTVVTAALMKATTKIVTIVIQ